MNIDLTHPEILTIEQLQKFVGVDSIDDRYELIELFYKYVAPLPQRIFRNNLLGTILTNNQREFQRILSSEEIDKQPVEEKHLADRGIYTVKSNTKNTAPIKLKRPLSTTTITITSNDQDTSKRLKSDPTNS